MKIKVLLSLVIVCGFMTVKAQLITVALQDHGTTTMFYGTTALNDANTAAQSGDTLYLPGNAYYPGFTVSKKLVIIGAGHRPDSTKATGRTYIQGNITFDVGSDSSVLEGIYTENSVIFNQTRINNVKISRNYLGGIGFGSSFDSTNSCLYCTIEQNIIDGQIECQNFDHLTIRNNVLNGSIYYVTQNTSIENNVIYSIWQNPLYLVYNAHIINNIFMTNNNVCNYRGWGIWDYINGNNNYVYNNIFPSTPTDACWGSNTWGTGADTNYTSIRTDTIFIGEKTGYTSFDYSQNYQLKKPALYPGYAGEGVGIYGGLVPFKEGGLPFNPHISQQAIAPKTDNSGNLNINVKVNAQNK